MVEFIMIVNTKKTFISLVYIFLISCSGGGGDNNDRSNGLTGRVVDGPLSKSQVFIDLNGNWQLDDNEPSAVTDEQGYFTIPAFIVPDHSEAHIVSLGGTDISTGKTLTDISFFADLPSDKEKMAFVTPLSSVVALAENTDEKHQIITAYDLNLNPEELVTTQIWEQAKLGHHQSEKILAINQKIALILQTATTMLRDDSGELTNQPSEVTNAIAKQLAAIDSTELIDLESTAILSNVLTRAFESIDNAEQPTPETILATGKSLAKINTLLNQADNSPTSKESLSIISVAQTDMQQSIHELSTGKIDAPDFALVTKPSSLFFDHETFLSYPDFDGDRLADTVDPDDDNDGVNDEFDAFPFDPSETHDNDLDGIGDQSDVDDDNDGVNDEFDAFPFDPLETRDTDLDGIGDQSDVDDDNDGVNDEFDALPLDRSETHDADLDGIGDQSDVDDDNDGVNDEFDAFPFDPSETHDTDLDGIGDQSDVDDDNDGVNDKFDAFPLDRSETRDTDLDGVGNSTDLFPFDPSKWFLATPENLLARIKNKELTLEWGIVEHAERYTIYWHTDSDVSASLYSGKLTTTEPFIALSEAVIDLPPGNKYYFVVSAYAENYETLPSLSIQIGVTEDPDPKPSGLTEIVMEDTTITPTALIHVEHLLLSQNDTLVENLYQGYKLSDIRIEIIYNDIDATHFVRFSNFTPRRFSTLNFVINGIGYRLEEPLDSFQSKDISFSNVAIDDQSIIDFLDPHPASTPNVRSFSSANTLETIHAYHLMQSDLKVIYSRAQIREEFYDYFLNKRKETKNSLLLKWSNVLHYTTPKLYKVYASASAGVASGSWLSLNWIMSKFLANPRYSYIYGTLTHEYAHTMGYGHNSGLAYGWDTNIRRQITQLWNEEVLIPGEISFEDANAFMWFDSNKNTLRFFSKEPERFSLDDIRFISPTILTNKIYTFNNEIMFDSFSRPSGMSSDIIVTATILNIDGTADYLAHKFISSWEHIATHDIYLNLTSKNYSAEAQGNSAIYFQIPDQDEVVSHDVRVGRSQWYAGGQSNIVVKAVNQETGEEVEVPLHGKAQGRFVINSGTARGNGVVKFTVNTENLMIAPGRYTGSFIVNAKGWNDLHYSADLKVLVDFIFKEPT